MRSPKVALPALCLLLVALLIGVRVASSRAADTDAPAGKLPTTSERFATLQQSPSPSYRRTVIPMMARAGCSARECHGSFQGRGGFQLSLFGSEWDADHVQITQKKGGEDELRVKMDDPAKSLILQKPTLQMPHKGKERFKKDSWQYNVLLKWITDGTANDAAQTGELERLEVTPGEIVFAHPGDSAQLQIVARWKDGTVEDVTDLTRFKTNDDTVASVSEAGLITCVGKGDSHIIASYDNGIVPIPVMLPVASLTDAQFPASASQSKVDELVLKKLRKMGIVPAEICTDSEFLRRVSLDLTGTLPAPEEIKAFLSDTSPDKRRAKIDTLLTSPAYAAWWATKFCDYTGDNAKQINFGAVPNRGAGDTSRQWYDWIEKRVAENEPYDKMVSSIVLATSRSSPTQSYKDYVAEMDSYFRASDPVNFANHPTLPYYWQRRNSGSPEEKALAFAHNFLGVRMECAQCHKHPFDRWTKTDFKQFAAFFGVVAVGNRPAMEGEAVSYEGIVNELKATATAEVDAHATTLPSNAVMAATTNGPATAPTTGPSTQPADEKALKKAKDAHDQLVRKAIDEETKRRIDTGGMVPWAEVFANTDGTKVLGKLSKGGVDPKLPPKVLGGDLAVVPKGTDSRQPLMDWLVSKSNPYFAKAVVNRVWASYFNRGIVDPPDDLNIANAPSNAELLGYLADAFVAHGYDLKWLHREILNSDTYQRSWKTNSTNLLDARNFSHAVVRQLPAEVMLDAVDVAIAGEQQLKRFATDMESRAIGPGGRARTGKDGKGGAPEPDKYFLTLFGKPARLANCDCERSAEPTLLQTLYTRNDPTLMSRIEDGKSWVGELKAAASHKQPLDIDAAINEVFLRTVSRPPSSEELSEARSDIAAAKAPVDGVRDLLWAMLNTREFKVNH